MGLPDRDRRSVFGAGVLSLALHVAVVLAAWAVPWPMPEQPASPEVSIVVARLIGASAVGEPPASPAIDRAAGRVPPEPVTAPERVLEPLPPAVREAAPPEDVEPPPGVAPPAPPETPTVPEPGRDDPEPPPDEERRELEPATPVEPAETELDDVDWEAEMQRAARDVVEQQARERERPTFSLEDLDEDEPPPLDPGPERSVFESSSSPSGPSLLSPSKTRSRAGRWLADKCKRLTGGLGVLGLFSLCAESNARSDLFASIKPDYLKARPQCTEVPQPVPVADGSDAPKKTHNCRLVIETE